MNLWTVIGAAFAAFIASAVYYAVFAKQRAKLSSGKVEGPSPIKIALELVRNLILATILSYFIKKMGVASGGEMVLVALMLWIAFPVLLLTGSIMYEKTPVKLAILHAGDWLLKLLIMLAIVSM